MLYIDFMNDLTGGEWVEDIFITGYSKVPKGITISEMYSVIVVSMVVEPASNKILAADCSLVTDLSRKYVKDILVGEDLKDFKTIEEKFKRKYFGSAKKALITASRICHDRYMNTLENCINFD